ncbi:MAG TPA: methylisocitrate lyase [Lacipirellulaceae bacterium]
MHRFSWFLAPRIIEWRQHNRKTIGKRAMADPTTTSGQILRATVAETAIQVPGAPNALAGRLIEEAGFSAVYLSGGSLSAGVLAMPDIGLLTLTELVQQVEYLTARVEIPVIVDADTGFGGVANVERTVAQLERAGAAAIQLEDQELPKRCGHLSGKTLVPAADMCAKLQAATAARMDENTVIIGRTDARGVEGFDAALDRARQYVEAGADWIFPEALANREEFQAFAEAIDLPLVANMTEFGRSPLLDFDDLAAIGYRVVLYPVTLLRVAMKAIESTLTMLAADGTQRELLDLMQTREELYGLLGYDADVK